MEPSKRERAISAAGRELERSLGLADSADTLSRWMAYRLAEVRAAAEAATDADAQLSARAEQDALIVALWSRRAELPGRIGLDVRLGASLELLETLRGEMNPWRRPTVAPEGVNALADALRHAFNTVVRSAVVLLHQRELVANGPEDLDLPLDQAEQRVLAEFTELSDLVLRRLKIDAGHPPANHLSAQQAVALLEAETAREIDVMADLLARFKNAIVQVDPDKRH